MNDLQERIDTLLAIRTTVNVKDWTEEVFGFIYVETSLEYVE